MPLDRKYVIFASISAFVSWALLTDFIPSLRWVPHAFIIGVLATTIACLYLILTTSKGINYHDDIYATRAPVAPAFTSATAWEAEKAALESRAEYRRPLIFPEAVAFSKAVDGLLDLILRDYVTSWYGAISPRPLFQHEIDRVIRSVLLTVVARITDFDIVEIGVSNLLPMVAAHMKDFYDAERAVRGKDLSHSVTESEELNTAIAGKYRNGKLHNAASMATTDTKAAQQQHLRSLVVKLLPIVLPDNMKSSPAVTVMVREIVTCAVLAPIMGIMEDPDTWNQLIVTFGHPMLQDRKAVRKVRAALEQNAPISPKTVRSNQFPRLRPYDSERQFEKFIRAIRHIQNLSDARRFRSDIISQLRRDASVEGQDAAYLRRLETGKRLLDQKITSLSANGERPRLAVQAPSMNDEATSRKRQASLREVIYDASGLSYYMEYMDRVQMMRLVQFYLVVDSFRGPLEGDNDDIDPSIAQDSDRMDIAQIYEGYLTKSEVKASEASIAIVKSYLRKGVDATPEDYIAARQAVLQAQTQVYNMMRQSHYESFKRSDLYYKWLAIDDNPAQSAMQSKQVGSPLSPESARSDETSPVRTRRPQLASANREPGLRRAVLSSSNLKDSSALSHAPSVPRRSFDGSSPRASLFDDDVDDERMAQSQTSLKSYDSDGEAAQQARDEAKAVDAMKAALDSIVADEDRDSLFGIPVTGRSLVQQLRVYPTTQVGQPSLQDRPSILVDQLSLRDHLNAES